MSWRVRPARISGGLAAALEKAVDIPSRIALLEHLREHYDHWGRAEPGNVSVEPYGYDERCDWDTHLICVNGHAALFAKGPMPFPLNEMCARGDHSFSWRSGLEPCRYCFAPPQKDKG